MNMMLRMDTMTSSAGQDGRDTEKAVVCSRQCGSGQLTTLLVGEWMMAYWASYADVETKKRQLSVPMSILMQDNILQRNSQFLNQAHNACKTVVNSF